MRGACTSPTTAALLMEGTPLVEDLADGLFIRSSIDIEREDSQAYRVAVRVWKYSVESIQPLNPANVEVATAMHATRLS